ncbi:basic leucine zipper 43-like [Momordica charantia]|uniref:Basic leucine zipper 43-like n=1 Tax=Momordica charantia TaxID=3673 RepID=A0A6J1D5Z9_MOMCH|nr:basic leucine zipper 43-like [Momordica charantia]
MLSTFPATFPSDAILGSSFLTCDGGFNPWESSEPFSIFQFSKPNFDFDTGLADIFLQPVESVNSSSSRSIHAKLNIDQIDSNRTDVMDDERRQRRMLSNRESAKRSRIRKQKQFESLRNQVNQLRIKKVEISNRLRFALFHCHRVLTENDRLQSEHVVLRRKLLVIRHNLLFRQLQQLFSEQFQPITKNNHIGF